MERNTRQLLVAFVWAGLLLAPTLLLAGPFAANGKVGTATDDKLKYAGGGWLSVSGQPPSPDPLGAAASTVPVEGDGKYWEFSTLTLKAAGGLTAGAAKGVSFELDLGFPKNAHLVDPHTEKPPENLLPGMKVDAPKGDIETGKSDTVSVFGDVPHIDSQGEHKDFLKIGANLKYSAGGALRTLMAEKAWIRAGHNETPASGWQDPPSGGFKYDSNVRYDVGSGLLSIMPGQAFNGLTPDDRLFGAMVHPLNFHFGGQNESGGWLFRGGHFGVHAPDISIQGQVDELVIDPTGGFGTLNGTASDGSQGASPWMNHLFAQLSDEAIPDVPGTSFGLPAIWLDTFFDLAQMTNGFSHSIDWMPVQVSFGSSLVHSEEHGLPGDYNGDRRVDIRDYSVWTASYGTQNSDADGNGDGIVDTADYALWRDNVGAISGHAAAGHLASNAVSVPEPSMAVLAMIALCLAVPAYRVPQLRRQRISDRGLVDNNWDDWPISQITSDEAEKFLEGNVSGQVPSVR